MIKMISLNILNYKNEIMMEDLMCKLIEHKGEFITLTLILIALLVYLVIMKTSKNPFKRSMGIKLSKNDMLKKHKCSYFREIPCNGDIFKAYFIATLYDINENVGDLLGAILLKWIKEEKIFIKKISSVYVNSDAIDLKKDETKAFTNKLEEKLYNILKDISIDGILEFKELRNWLKNSPSEISGWFDMVIAQERGYLIKNNDLIQVKSSISKKYKINDSLKKEAYNILGFKKFLLDFSEMEKKQAKESHIWEEYLLFAQMLGIATKIEREFNQLYPNLLEDINRLNFCPVASEEDETSLDKYQF